jgi:hypothetical protein
MSSVLSARLFDDIKVLKDNLAANLDIENSLPLVLEIHFSEFQNNCIDSLSNRQFIRHLAISMPFIHINILVESEPKLIIVLLDIIFCCTFIIVIVDIHRLAFDILCVWDVLETLRRVDLLGFRAAVKRQNDFAGDERFGNGCRCQ